MRGKLYNLYLFLFVFISADNSGSKCCYDAFGNLKYAGDYEIGVTTIGSISMRAHIAGSPPYDAAGTVPMLSHAKADLIPYFHCCLLAGNCMKYLHRRPTADCYDYDTPKTGKFPSGQLRFEGFYIKHVRYK